MARKSKYKQGTADAFRYKKNIAKITPIEAEAIISDIADVYQEYREQYDNANNAAERQIIEEDYLYKVDGDIQRVKAVAGQYWDLQPGVSDIISDVYYNMEYTRMIAGRETIQRMKTKRGRK